MILAVAGGKGGVGTSTVAYNIGAELDAVVVDADLAMTGRPTGPGPDLTDVLAGRADPVDAVRTDGPVRVLPGGRSLAAARSTRPRSLVDAVSTVETAHDRVVVDCPSGLGSIVGLGLLAADACVPVTTPSPVAVADASPVVALARELDAGLARVALSRAGPDPPRQAVRLALGAPTVPIPASTAVRTAMRHGHPVSTTEPGSAPAEAFETLAAGIQHSCRSL